MNLNKICLITSPIGRAGNIPLSNLLNISSKIFKKIYVITGDEVNYNSSKNGIIKISKVKRKVYSNLFFRGIYYFLTQFKITYELIKIIKYVDLVLFFIGGDTLIFPMVTAKLFQRKTVLIFSGSQINTSLARNDRFGKFSKAISKINCFL